ncbi:hypothetical protein [Roseomonas sp. BN140053]|uniref:hypothetical protein n=1 Tax=Roseomonas sp. BN140053 TaxID=3391898 RepID=UPI0039ED9970
MATRRILLGNAVRLGVLGLATAGLAACNRAAPVYNVSSSSFTGSGSLAQRSIQIKRAGAGLNWVMEDEGPGRVRGTLNRRSHQAIVLIFFDTNSFSIQYESSTNLNYDGASIHRNYNGWVQELQQAITAQSALP